ncbi:phosphotransferase [Bradyrhizobium sp. 83002]|uniref:phosphotransferase n=1 Tax=Bradyrhizobium aeschynomenes TaxID=2734909 RepID=UPI00155605B0|nr:phosphotransferase [Bradyrhizobium aeschynomenes]NPU14483.1 phosphotransferase [Bradyrhizobium aeschynomenes]
MTSPALPSVVDPARLTEALRASGALRASAVREVTVLSARDIIVSRIIRLGVSYDGPAPDAPQTLILKVAQENFAKTLWQGGQKEVAFYTTVAPHLPGQLVPRCFGAHWDGDSHDWHLLLEDLTDSHQIATEWPLPPTLAQAGAIVEAMARLHAAWWDHPDLGRTIGQFIEPAAMAQVMTQLSGHLERFTALLGDRLSADRREVYRRFIASTPRLLARYHSHRHLTIAHGDAHSWNFLLAKPGVADRARVFDFDQWRINVGANDLAYLMGLQWYPERRRQVERDLLDGYHEALLGHGVTGYSRAALDDDYRYGVLWQITKPVWQWTANIPPIIWWNNLERIFLAVDDLGCRELLD